MSAPLRFALLLLAAALLACGGSTPDPQPAPLPPLSGAGGGTYVVAPDGSDAAAGTEAAPWGTIQHGADQLRPGDTLLVRAGVYAEAVTVRRSGTADAPVTIAAYPGDRPVLDGGTLTVPEEDSGLFLLVDQSYVTIRGFELRGYQSDVADVVPVGIHVRGAGRGLTLADNVIHAIATTAPPDAADAHAIAVYGDAAQPIADVTIAGNQLYDLTLGSSEALVLNGNVAGFAIVDNVVRDSDNIGIDLIGFEGTAPDDALDQARDGVVSGNRVYNIDSGRNPAYDFERSAGGIYVDGGRDILIENNVVHDSNIGIELASEHAGRATANITVRGNLVYDNHIAGISLGGYDRRRGATTGCVVERNTLFNNDSDAQGNGELLLQYDVRDCQVRANIFFAGAQGLLVGNPFTANEGNVFADNVYFTRAAPEWAWRDEYLADLAAWQAGSGESGARFVEPQFVDEAGRDLRQAPASPTTGAGVP